MAVRLVNLDAAVLGEALEQLNALLEHVVPGVVARVGQLQVLTRRPLLEQDCRWIFVTEQSRHRLLEAAAEKHGGANIFLLPAIEIAMAVTARAGQVLGNLGVAVVHHDALFLPRALTVASRRDGDGSGQFFPLAGRGEAVEVHQRDAVDHGVADLHDPDQAAQGSLVDFVLAQQFGVIEKIPQEPAQLPHRLGGAVETADDRAPGKWLGLENGEPEQIKALLGLPAMLRTIEPDEKYAVGNLGVRITCGIGESGNMTFHPATSWLGRA